MKAFVVHYKKHLLIAGAAILMIAVVAALILSRYIHSPRTATEPVPKGRIHDAGVFGDDVLIHDSTEGEIVIDIAADDTPAAAMLLSASGPAKLVSNPDDIWTEDTYAGNHTPVEKAKMADGSIGVLTIDKLKLSANVFQSPDAMEDMKKGIAHFPSTSAWDGNVSFSAHNVNFDGSDGYFKYLYTLSKGDTVRYSTKLGERTYVVESVATIVASDWTPLYHTDHNQLVMITCISGQPNNRLCVTAVEQAPA